MLEWITNNKTGLIIYLIINVVVFAMYGIDKFKAIKNRWRIPETTLISAALFGVIGAIAGMLVFHHKIRKPKFYVIIPIIFVIEAICTGYVISTLV